MDSGHSGPGADGVSDIFSFYKEHPKTCDPKDYWGQVMRIVRGRPVGEDQIQMIVDAVLSGLQIRADDVLLDLGCGNGALTDRIFSHCQGGLGVDFSPSLIEVAERDFAVPGQRDYHVQDALGFAIAATDTTRFTRALCYGALMFLTAEAAEKLLESVNARFPNVERFMLGNMPDRRLIKDFFRGGYRPGMEDDPAGATGIWRTEEDFAELARRTGWECSITRMPPEFFAAHYRYDVILTRPVR